MDTLERVTSKDEIDVLEVDGVDEHSLTLVANKSLDLSRSLTDHCHRLADMAIKDVMLPSEPDLHDDVILQDKPEVKKVRKPSISSTAPENGRNCEAREVHREQVALEILETERKYCSSMWVLLDHFVSSIRRSQLVSDEVLKIMFPSCLEEIYKYHCDFLQKLDIKMINWSSDRHLGGVLSDFFKSYDCPMLQQYHAYMNGFSNSLLKIRNVSKESSAFSNLLKTLEDDPRCDRLDIASFLLTPIQRMPRYVLLFKELLKSTDKRHEDWLLIDQCMNEVGIFLNKLNNSIEQSIKLVSLKSGIKSKRKFGISSLSLKQSSTKLSKQISDLRSSSELPRAANPSHSDPMTSTPVKQKVEVDGADFEDDILRTFDDKQYLKFPSKTSTPLVESSPCLCTYQEYLQEYVPENGSIPEDGYIPDGDRVPEATSPDYDDLPNFRTLDGRLKKHSATRDNLYAEVDAKESDATFQLSRKSGKHKLKRNNSSLGERFFKRFKTSSEKENDEGNDELSVLNSTSSKSFKNSLKSMWKFRSSSSIKKQASTVSLNAPANVSMFLPSSSSSSSTTQ